MGLPSPRTARVPSAGCLRKGRHPLSVVLWTQLLNWCGNHSGRGRDPGLNHPNAQQLVHLCIFNLYQDANLAQLSQTLAGIGAR